MIELIKALSRVQKALHAPKDNKNSFGNYNYRSCEDILTAVKPLLEDDELVTLDDDIVLIGDRYYIKAIATFYKGDKTKSVNGLAREDLSKKGMDLAQLTGSCSSYARKYALGGLLAIDNEKDADTQDNTQPPINIPEYGKPTYNNAEQEKEWYNLFDKQGNAHQNKWEFAYSCFEQSGKDVNQAINKIAEIYKVNTQEREYLSGALK